MYCLFFKRIDEYLCNLSDTYVYKDMVQIKMFIFILLDFIFKINCHIPIYCETVQDQMCSIVRP